MSVQAKLLLVTFLLLTTTVRSSAQVESVAARTRGLSCGVCGLIVELYLRNVPGVDKITMSMSREILQVTYKAGASFRPDDIREALQKSEVEALQFQISARGQIEEQEGKQVFVAGRDRFLLVASDTSPKPLLDTPISVVGIVNDDSRPMQLELLSVKQLKQ